MKKNVMKIVANYRRVFRTATLVVLMTMSGGIFAQTVSVSPVTGNVISTSSYSDESHLEQFGGLWVHNQLPMTLVASDKGDITENGLMKEHANNVKADGNVLVFASGESSTVINHMSLSLPRGYRFTSYKMVLDYDTSSENKSASTMKEMDASFTDNYESVTVSKGSTGVTMQRTSLNQTDMGNILYFRQEHPDGMARVRVVSFVVTFECTDKFGLILRPDPDEFSSPVSCLSLPFHTNRVDVGQITKATKKNYTSYKYDYSKVKNLMADFLFYDMQGIVDGTAVPGTVGDQSVVAMKNTGDRTFLALKNNTYWLESPTDALLQDGTTAIPVGYRIVGARIVYSNVVNPDIKPGDNILISDGNGNFMNHELKFTTDKVVWNYASNGKVSTMDGSKEVYLRHISGWFGSSSLATTTNSGQASAFKTDGLNLFYGSGNSTFVVSFDSDGNGVYNIPQQYALAVNADYSEGNGPSFKIKLFDKTGTNVEKEAMVDNSNPSGDLVIEKINNDAVKIQIEGLEEGQLAYVCLEVQLEALNPYIDKVDISCTQPSGEKKLKNQYLADDFTIGTDGKVDFSVPTNFGNTGLRFAFEELHSKYADETYTGIGTQGEYSRYNFVKSQYYNLIDENLQEHRDEAADFDYNKKLSVSVAGDKAFYCNNSDKFKAGTSGDDTFMYEEYRYSNAKYTEQGGLWTEILANNGDDYQRRYLVVCDETRYNIAPTTTPRHAYYAYYSTDLKLSAVDYQPVIEYTTVYNDAMLTSGYDSNRYVGATVSLVDADNNPVPQGTGYAYAKQVADKINSDIEDKAENAPVDSKHILYFDASGINSLLFSTADPTWGKLEDLKAEFAENALLYLPQGVTYGLNNVATRSMYGDDFVASNDVVLTDQKPFYAPYDIRMNAANQVVYSRLMSPGNDTKKWVSLILPFTVAVDMQTGMYEQNSDRSQFTFYTMSEDNAFSNSQEIDGSVYDVDAHFQPYTGVPVTAPNTPYLVGIDRLEGDGSEAVQMFVVRQSGATIVKTPTSPGRQDIQGRQSQGRVGGEASSITCYGSFSGAKLPKENGVMYFNKDKFISSLVLAERYDAVYVLPFRAFYNTENSAAKLRYMSISTDPNDVTETTGIARDSSQDMRQPIVSSTAPGMLSVRGSWDMDVAVYSISGQRITAISVAKGETKTVQLPSGLYLVNGEKVFVR